MEASITDDNTLVSNQGKHPLVNFNFMLRVEALFDLPCKSVHAFSRELEYDLIQEGGLNDYVHMRRKPISKPFTLEIERYVGIDYFDCMPLGAELVLPVLLFVSRYGGQFIPMVVARTYVFTGCTVMKKNFGDLTGDQSGLLVETTTLAYREMLCVDVPWSMVGQKLTGTPNGIQTAVGARESLERIKELSAAARKKVKNAGETAQKTLDTIAADAGKLAEAIAAVGTVIADLDRDVTDQAGKLPTLQADYEKAAKAVTAQKTAFDEKTAAFDAAKKTLAAARRADNTAQTEKKSAENAASAARWKAGRGNQNLSDAEEKAEASATAAQELSEQITEKQSALQAAQTRKTAAEQAQAEAGETVTAAQRALETARRERVTAQSALDEAEEIAEADGIAEARGLLAEAVAALSLAESAVGQATAGVGAAQRAKSAAEAEASQLESQIASLKNRETQLKKTAEITQTAAGKTKALADGSEADAKAAETAADEAQKAAEASATAVEKAETALLQPQEAWTVAQKSLTDAEATAAAGLAALSACQTEIRDKKAARGKAQDRKKLLEAAEKAKEFKLSTAKAYLDAIPDNATKCGEEDDRVQSSESVDEANRYYPTVQRTGGDVQKALSNLQSISAYFKNCLTA
ncbi:MAG: hypothetical protein RR426_02355 [Oscillospiraceae bacterium]